MSEPEHRFGPFSPHCSPARAQLRAAMIELVPEPGLETLSVETLCRRAAVPPAVFERDFDGIQDCALQVFLADIEEFDRALREAADPADPWRSRLRATAYAAARYVRDHPRAIRFDMIAILEIGELAQAHRDRYVRRLVDIIDEGRGELADPSAVSRSAAEGVFGSIYRLLSRELVGKGRTGRAEEAVPELMYLAVRPYLGEEAAREELTIPPPPERDRQAPLQNRENNHAHESQGERAAVPHLAMLAPVKKRDPGPGEAPGRLPRLPPGRHGLSREFVSQNQRDRITAGIIAAVAERGYHDATVTAITEAAGLSRRTFYTYFESKDACFFATFDLIADHLRHAAGAAAAPVEGWPAKVRARLAAVLDVFAANPDIARFVLIAPPRAGSEIADRYRRAMDEVLVELLEGMPPELAAKQPSRTAELAMVGGAAALVVRKVEAGEGTQLPELLPDLFEHTLAPFIGRAEALRLARSAS